MALNMADMPNQGHGNIDPTMDGVKLKCYDLHILMILCSQLVYLHLSII
jgi:hypothetical protein